jgi:hypothetical protein
MQADNARASSRFTEGWKDGGHAPENGIGARFPPFDGKHGVAMTDPACRTAATIAGVRQARFHFGTMRSASVS